MVRFPHGNGGSFHSYVKLPKGKPSKLEKSPFQNGHFLHEVAHLRTIRLFERFDRTLLGDSSTTSGQKMSVHIIVQPCSSNPPQK